MKNFIVKNKKLIFASAAVFLVLTVTFFSGGAINSKKSSSGTKIKSSMSATNDNALQNTTSVQKNSTVKSCQNQTQANTQSKKSTASASSQSKTSAENKVKSTNSDNSKASADSSTKKKDKYRTDPIPQGKPKPVEPEEQTTADTQLYCTFSISCATINDNIDKLDNDKKSLVPADGWILKPAKVTFNKGESVFSLLQKVCKDKKIHMESTWTPIYNSAYIEGINNIYEFDCGSLSGWMYCVNGWYPNYGSSRYEIKSGDVIEWKYTCNLGSDIGGKNSYDVE